jgi:hypothetical protein
LKPHGIRYASTFSIRVIAAIEAKGATDRNNNRNRGDVRVRPAVVGLAGKAVAPRTAGRQRVANELLAVNFRLPWLTVVTRTAVSAFPSGFVSLTRTPGAAIVNVVPTDVVYASFGQ